MMRRFAHTIGLWMAMGTLTAPNAHAGGVQAVVVSAGHSRLLNHERYWNDCAFLYRTLRHDHLLPKEHITLLMADGDDPAADMLLNGATGLASSPTDLDDDGAADLSLAATKENLAATLSLLSRRLTREDHLFIYITGHGELDEQGGAYLWMWNRERLRADELAAMLGSVNCASVAIVVGLCHAGAFMRELQGAQRVVMASSSADELSWACADRPYDEFVYHWTCAIAGHDEQGHPIEADSDGDGHVSLAEAFSYARGHDRRPETPAMSSQPSALAGQWTFGGLLNDAGIGPARADRKTTIRHDLQGRCLKQGPTQGLYIENGHIIIKKLPL